MYRKLSALAALAAGILLMPVAAVAQAPPMLDYVSGAGFWQATGVDDPGPGSVGLRVTAPGGGGDEFDYRRQSDGRGFHAVEVCLSVEGNRAWMLLAVQESNLPTIPVGTLLPAYAEDNGDGQSDLFDLDPPFVGDVGTCGRTVAFDPDPVRGNLDIHDRDLFLGPF